VLNSHLLLEKGWGEEPKEVTSAALAFLMSSSVSTG